MRRSLCIALLLLVACSGEESGSTSAGKSGKAEAPPPPTAQAAHDLIAGSQELSEYQFTNAGWSVAISLSPMSPTTREQAQQLEKAGWLGFDGAGNIVLTERALADPHFILRPNGILDIVPLAKKEMGEVTAVRPEPDGTVSVDFTWRWIPNDIGESFTSGPIHDRLAGEQHSTGKLMWNGTEWIVLGIH